MGGILRQYGWAVNLVGILFCSFFLAKITGIYVGRSIEVARSVGMLKAPEAAPVERAQGDIAQYQIIVDRNIFDSTERASPEPGAAGALTPEPDVPAGEAVRTSLGITVIGVLVVGSGEDSRSTATVSGGKDKGAAVYAVGDKDKDSFALNTRLVRVKPDRIEFLNGSRLEYAELATEFGADIFGPPKREDVAMATPEEKAPKEALIRKETPGKFTVDQREIDEAMQNLDKLYTDIRAVPNFSGGKVQGMKILSVKGDSLFAKLGLRRGDVLQKINGMELDVKRGFEIFNQLKDQKNITLDLLRQGQATTLEYEIR